MSHNILIGDALEQLKTLPDETVQCIVSSPPYWGLRDYGVPGQLGLESTPEEYCANLVQILREGRRVLHNDGTLWLILGDSYAGGGNYRGVNSESTLTEKQRSNRGARGVSQQLGALGKETGCKPKDLIGIPWMVAFALRADGWYLRQDIIWAKPNPMPESVKDRCTKSHEYVFLLSKSRRYYFDARAINEVAVSDHNAGNKTHRGATSYWQGDKKHRTKVGLIAYAQKPNTQVRNKRDVWTIVSQPYKGAHFAVFPEKLVEPCILAGTKPGDTVLDPFCGSGTVGLVSRHHGRNFIGIDLNPEYIALAHQRIAQGSKKLIAA